MVQGICRKYARTGTCSYGDRCKFSHASDQTAGSKAVEIPQTPFYEPSDDSSPERPPIVVDFPHAGDFEHEFSVWKRSVDWADGDNLSSEAIRDAFNGCKSLLDTGSPGIQQDAMEELTKDFPQNGLNFIVAAAKTPAFELQKILLPVLQVLTYPAVVQSFVCEESMKIIYTALYGTDGEDGTSFFRSILEVLAEPDQKLEQADPNHETLPRALEVFARMVKLNDGAAGSDNIKEVAKQLGELGMEVLANPEHRRLAQIWKELEKTFVQGRTMSDDIENVTEQLEYSHVDGNRFSRHDNDHANISRIQILPTAGEIASTVPEYLPSKDPYTHHIPGARGLLDRQFRLLREDTVGRLRDAVKQTSPNEANRQKSRIEDEDNRAQSIRFKTFRNATITGSLFDKMLGLLHIVEFDQPRPMQGISLAARRQAWTLSRDLSVGTVVCVAADDHAVFLTVADRDPADDENSRRRTLQRPGYGNKPMTLYENAKRAALILKPITLSEGTLTQVFQRQYKPSNSKSTLIEFPGLLLASFNYTLSALQQMNKAADLPFAGLLAPNVTNARPNATAQPPRYTTEDGFEFDLTQVANGVKTRFHPQRPFDLARFSAASGLDESQAKAFIFALSNEFALIQGPPGTGKSFIGVKLIQALLQNKSSAHMGPIICVCYTNHALDQILEHLVLKGIPQTIRIGGRSKSDLLYRNNLSQLADQNSTANERFKVRMTHRMLEELSKDANPALQKMSDSEPTSVKHIFDLCERFEKQKHWLDNLQDEVSLRCLRQADVIGITATGLARQTSMLKMLNPKVLIIEEAGEILEAHTLPSLLPSLEHVIAIGDHRQLRPQIENIELSVDNDRGKDYSFDVSLFERLIHPEAGLPSQPYATLQVQRRMHPSISKLIKSTIYPSLIDDKSVEAYPGVATMRHRVFWFDHESPESAEGFSKGNEFEVGMTVALVTHLVEHGKYDASRITVLTPYLAQMRKLQSGFARRFDIDFSDKDKSELRAAGMFDRQARAQVSLGAGLRISTVDNYQGEEADIVVVSLVRSNRAGNVGFLRTPNRINVLLSRARHGMYLIGNASVARNVDMWRQVIEVLREDDAIGTTIPVVCPQHKVAVSVSGPGDFASLIRKNGCNAACRQH